MGLLDWEWDHWNENGNGTTGMGMGPLEWEQEWDCSLEVARAGRAAQELHQPLAGLPAVMQKLPHIAHPLLQLRPTQSKQ